MVDSRLRTTLRELATGEARWPLYLWGTSGAGKTMAALCLVDYVPPAGRFYATVGELCDAVMAQEAKGNWKQVREAELAILDEIGERRNIGDLDYTTVKRFMDLRESRQGRVAIYISNLSPGDLQKAYDDRIASRALCGTVFELKGSDRRFTTQLPTSEDK